MDDIVEAGPPPAPRTRTLRATGLVAAGLVAGVVLAGVTAATAQSGDPSPAPSGSSAPGEVRPHKAPGMRGFKHGMHGFGRGALHGEFTTRAPGGGFQTMAMQRGEVTAVSATSITVRSADDFSRTYAVNDDTLVNAGNEGIDDVSAGDTVHVLAIVDGGTARAVHVHDGTKVRGLREKWAPARPNASPTP